MVLPFSKSQIERLGKRLVQTPLPEESLLADLGNLLLAYDEVLEGATSAVRRLGYEPTGRVKNTGTILEKLRRHGGSWLKSIQDLAGMRVVVDGGRREQDEVVAAIAELFATVGREPKLVDRRLCPSHGYRAVHLVVFPDGVPVEIQVRTKWQHEWADMFEKFADLVGRGIRYGEPPAEWWDDLDHPPDEPPGRAALVRKVYDATYAIHVAMVKSAISLSDLIAALEDLEVIDVDMNSELAVHRWQSVHDALADFREQLKDMEPVPQKRDLGSVGT
ncbi:hypothetical protein [Streptomyces sp. 150FB]|uniref:hypothetical protein n=1 Tax=Streptomyces sp. 150FB TaxID=1576605 RepID=UPI00069642F1|nr:hypothetical protein [Streptomyces sp. 150FB]